MYKLSVPISVDVLTEETLPIVLKRFQQCKVERVFLAILEAVYSPNIPLFTDPSHIQRAIDFFKENGIEVGIWMNSFGHGAPLVYQEDESDQINFTPLEGVYGDKYSEGYCPLDKKFADRYSKAVRAVARMHPDLIMLDDDFRLNTRLYYMGCFCPNHLAEYYKRIGEEVPRDQLERLIFTGGDNKYRTAYMELAADTLLDFAKMLRGIVDEEDPSIRMSISGVNENWDYNGTDCMEIARALGGNTAPFLRINGAPYWGDNILEVIEDSRMEFFWCKDTGVEVFAEGDTYPRPRYRVPAKRLELFDLALLCDGNGSGILKYMFDYTLAFGYETGYADRHLKNAPLRIQAKEIFGDKTPVGVHAFNVLHKVKNWVLPETCPKRVANRLMEASRSSARNILSRNSIPTTYTPGDYPVLLFSENARYATTEMLKNGAILDIPAAKILMEQGIDVGLVSAQKQEFVSEHFVREKDEVYGVDNGALYAVTCSAQANVLSFFNPGNSPASYTYENAAGQRFLVLAYDHYFADANKNYTNTYYRQAHLAEAITWMCGKALPAFCPKNPDLYILASQNEEGMAVALINAFMDEADKPVIRLDKVYSQIRFINCTGRLEGDKVFLEDIGSFEFAAFEVK